MEEVEDAIRSALPRGTTVLVAVVDAMSVREQVRRWHCTRTLTQARMHKRDLVCSSLRHICHHALLLLRGLCEALLIDGATAVVAAEGGALDTIGKCVHR